MQFTGICTYPHGGYSTAGLFVTCVAAVMATCFGVFSCKLVIISFTSDQGDFEEYFDIYGRSTVSNELTKYRTGLGLFNWLHPLSSRDWSDGYCVGYQQSMLEHFDGEPFFDAARGVSVFAVLIGFGITISQFAISCIIYNRIQLNILRILLLLCAICSGTTLLFTKSKLCNELFVESSCSIDEGGMLLIGAVVLWLAAFLVAVVFFRPVDFVYKTPKDRAASKEKAELDAQIASLRARKQPLPLHTIVKPHVRPSKSSGSNSEETKRHKTKSPAEPPTMVVERRTRKADPPQDKSQIRQFRPEPPGGRAEITVEPTAINVETVSDTSSTITQRSIPKPRVVQAGDAAISEANTEMAIVSLPPKRKTRQAITVDDVNNQGNLEVYIAQRLNRIEEMTEV